MILRLPVILGRQRPFPDKYSRHSADLYQKMLIILIEITVNGFFGKHLPVELAAGHFQKEKHTLEPGSCLSRSGDKVQTILSSQDHFDHFKMNALTRKRSGRFQKF